MAAKNNDMQTVAITKISRRKKKVEIGKTIRYKGDSHKTLFKTLTTNLSRTTSLFLLASGSLANFPAYFSLFKYLNIARTKRIAQTIDRHKRYVENTAIMSNSGGARICTTYHARSCFFSCLVINMLLNFGPE
jgi:hypothetical protein